MLDTKNKLMNYPLIEHYMDRSNQSDYLSRINFGSSTINSKAVDVPLIHIINSDLINQTIDTNTRLAVIMPNCFYSAYWSTFLTSLTVINKGFIEQNIHDKYSSGQKLLFNNKYVVEFQSFLDNGGICVKTSDAIYTINQKFQGQLKAIKSNRALSPIKKILSEESVLTKMSHPIDKILDVNSLGDMPLQNIDIILCTKVGSAVEFITKRKIDGYPINQIINFGKIDINGEVEVIGSGQAANINILLTNDPLSINYYLSNNTDKKKIILFDKLSLINNNFSTVKEIITDHEASVLLFSDYSDLDNLSQLKELNFLFWHWSMDKFQTLPLNTDHYYFAKLNSSITKYKHYDISLEILKSPLLADIIENLNHIERNIPDDNHILKSEYINIYTLVLTFSRMVFSPEKEYIEEVTNKLENIKSNIVSHKSYLEKTIFDTLNLCIDFFIDLISDFNKNLYLKIEKITEIFNTKDYKGYYLLVQKSEHVDMVDKYWQSILSKEDYKKINIISMSELLNAEPYKYYKSDDCVLIVCGWLNKKNMNKIFTEQTAFSQLILLFYEHEYRWYKSVVMYWERIFSDLDRNQIKVHNANADFDHGSSRNYFPLSQSNEKSDFDIIEFEKKISNYSNARYTGSDINELLKTYKIYFSYDRIMFATETHKFFVLHDIYDDKEKINIKTADKIELNSLIVLSYASRDIVKNKADMLLSQDQYNNARSIAFLWRKALIQYYHDKGNDVKVVVNDLSESGCNKHLHTIKYWLFDDNIIGPQNLDEIDIISKLTRSTEMESNLNNIKKSIKIIRGYHQKAAFAIKTSLFDHITSFLANMEIEDIEKKDYIKIDTEEFGEILILKILDIDKETINISHKFVNRLIEQE